MNLEIYIEGRKVDVDDKSLKIAKTVQQFEFLNIGSVRSDRTNRVTLPLTNNNKKFLEQVAPLSIASSKTSQNLGIRVVVDGLDYLLGVCQITGIDERISLDAQSSVKTFFDLIKGKYLSDVNTLLNIYAVTSSEALKETYAARTSELVYPLVDSGYVVDGTTFGNTYTNHHAFLPAYFYKSVMDAIFRLAGFSKVGAVFSDQVYRQLAIQLKPFYSEDFLSKFTCSATKDSLSLSAGANADVIWDRSYPGFNYAVGSNVRDPLNFNAPTAGSRNIRFQAQLPNAGGWVLPIIHLMKTVITGTTTGAITVNGVSRNAGTFEVVQYSIPSSGSDSSVNIVAGGSAVTVTNINITQTVVPSTDTFVPHLQANSIGEYWVLKIADLFPRFTISEFIKDFISMFGLLVRPVEPINQINFTWTGVAVDNGRMGFGKPTGTAGWNVSALTSTQLTSASRSFHIKARVSKIASGNTYAIGFVEFPGNDDPLGANPWKFTILHDTSSNNYKIYESGTLQLTIPTTPVIGDILEIICFGIDRPEISSLPKTFFCLNNQCFYTSGSNHGLGRAYFSFNGVGSEVQDVKYLGVGLESTLQFDNVFRFSFEGSTGTMQRVGESGFKKSAGAIAWDSHVYSVNGFIKSAYLKFKSVSASLNVMMGLNSDPTLDANFTSLDYAFYLTNSGTLQIYESSSLVGSFGSYLSGDTFEVIFDGNYIIYKKNGTELRKVGRSPSSFLYFDSAFDLLGEVADVVFRETVNEQPAGGELEFVHVEDVLNQTVPLRFPWSTTGSVGTIVRTDGAGFRKAGANTSADSWDSHVYSLNGFVNSAYLRFIAIPKNAARLMMALNSDPTSATGFPSLDYAIYNNGLVGYEIYESSVLIGSFGGAPKDGDVCEIIYDGSNVVYKINGVTLRTVARSIGAALYLDSSFANINAEVGAVVFSNGSQATSIELSRENLNSKPSINYVLDNFAKSNGYYWTTNEIDKLLEQFGGAVRTIDNDTIPSEITKYQSIWTASGDSKPLQVLPRMAKIPIWDGSFNTFTSGVTPIIKTANGGFKKNGGANAWDSKVYSSAGISGYASVRFKPVLTTHSLMIALNSDPTASSSFTSLDYALYLRPDATIDIWESNVLIGSFGAYSVNDLFEIIYDPLIEAILYLRNNSVIRSVSRPLSGAPALHFDSSFNTSNSEVEAVSFTNGGWIKAVSGGNRLLLLKLENGPVRFIPSHTGNRDYNRGYFIDKTQPFTLDFEELLNKYYKRYYEVLNNGYVDVEQEFLIKLTELSNLDTMTVKSKDGQLYILERVENYISGYFAKFKLIKI